MEFYRSPLPADLNAIKMYWRQTFPHYAPLKFIKNMVLVEPDDPKEKHMLENDEQIQLLLSNYRESPSYRQAFLIDKWNRENRFGRPKIIVRAGHIGIIVENFDEVQDYVRGITQSSMYKKYALTDPLYDAPKDYDEAAVKLMEMFILPFVEKDVHSKYDVVIFINQHGCLLEKDVTDIGDIKAYEPPEGRHVTILQATPTGTPNMSILLTMKSKFGKLVRDAVNKTGEINAVKLREKMVQFSTSDMKNDLSRTPQLKRNPDYMTYMKSPKWNLFEDAWTDRRYSDDESLNSIDVLYDKLDRLPPEIMNEVSMLRNDLYITRNDVLNYLWGLKYTHILLLDASCSSSNNNLSARAMRRMIRNPQKAGSRKKGQKRSRRKS